MKGGCESPRCAQRERSFNKAGWPRAISYTEASAGRCLAMTVNGLEASGAFPSENFRSSEGKEGLDVLRSGKQRDDEDASGRGLCAQSYY
ncbi:hypothetical protein RRG08_035372 [Elysia crispata]|uniref:Uncharacterized protein n=1 Tax=Elysia crispata TaxID=231223 RepID=A0AAE0Y3C7_9GAST|nr:hypothetical protein RRG08_035372 [Elysia crispata]